jgi:hypothetical protein
LGQQAGPQEWVPDGQAKAGLTIDKAKTANSKAKKRRMVISLRYIAGPIELHLPGHFTEVKLRKIKNVTSLPSWQQFFSLVSPYF